ncbi:MAG: translesion error-prone DNA polymerase V autoproteolytic subunit [Bacteroidota bacterium]|nr:translesion error-prone DNA polymerase V autoproteolytic subunit [Bacteroidota bacterium]
MDGEDFSFSAFKGTKNFTQWQVATANATGFGAPADDYAERGIDLNEQLVQNKAATFYMRVNSTAMTGAGIFNGDVVIVDRSIEANNGKIIIAVIDGELLIRKLEIIGNKKKLVPATSKLSPIDVDGELKVWGVVTYVIHKL